MRRGRPKMERSRGGRGWRRAWILCGALALAWGCGGAEEPARGSAEDVREETREAVDAATDYAALQRENLTRRAEQTAEEVERELADARSELEELPEQTRGALERAIDRAERARRTLGEALDALEEAGAAHWETARRRLSDALAEVAEAQREIGEALTGEES